MADWIEWKGGECPVPPGTIVQIQYADETRERASKTSRVRADRFLDSWRHEHPHSLNIIAYRVVGSSEINL